MKEPSPATDFRNLALVIMIVMPLVLLYIQSLAAPHPVVSSSRNLGLRNVTV